MTSKKHAEPAHDREQLLVEHERLRVAQTQTQDLTTEEARERAKRMGEIERELAGRARRQRKRRRRRQRSSALALGSRSVVAAESTIVAERPRKPVKPHAVRKLSPFNGHNF